VKVTLRIILTMTTMMMMMTGMDFVVHLFVAIVDVSMFMSKKFLRCTSV